MLTLAIILAVILLILLIPVNLRIYLKYHENELNTDFRVKYGVITVFKLKPRSDNPPKKKTKDKPRGDKQKKNKKPVFKKLWQRRVHIKRFIVSVAKYVADHIMRIKKLYLHGTLGLSDAAQTGIVYGASSAVIYNVIGYIDKKVSIKGIDIDYKPDFTNEVIFIEFESIIRTNIYHVLALAVIAGVRVIPIVRKEKDNGKSN